jgi:hypothetical protein
MEKSLASSSFTSPMNRDLVRAGLPDFYCYSIPKRKNIPNDQQIYQMAIKHPKRPTSSIARPSKIYPNWNFWFENAPSGNPGVNELIIIFWCLSSEQDLGSGIRQVCIQACDRPIINQPGNNLFTHTLKQLDGVGG